MSISDHGAAAATENSDETSATEHQVHASEHKLVCSPTSECIDSGLFRQGMRRVASGVVVVTTEHEGRRSGLVMTGFASVSVDPPILLICVNRTASSHDILLASKRFCVNALHRDDTDLAARFSSPNLRESRFDSREWQELKTGAPALVGCLASFDCAVENTLSASTHTIFIGSVQDLRLWSSDIDPLLYWDGDYKIAMQSR
jgi:flavin reductase